MLKFNFNIFNISGDVKNSSIGVNPTTINILEADKKGIHIFPNTDGMFTGRQAQLESLKRFTDNKKASSSTIINIFGMPGSGKSALAIHYAHSIKGGYKNLVYFNLRGANLNALTPEDALDELIKFIAPSYSGSFNASIQNKQAILTKELSAGRTLLLLDNARDEEQVRHLIPLSQNNLVLVTSRNELLQLQNCKTIKVIGFSDREALEYLKKSLSVERVNSELSAANELAGLCGNLPIALKISAYNLRSKPSKKIKDFNTEITNEKVRINLQDTQDNLKALFNLSYNELPKIQKKLFRLTALLEGTSIHPRTAVYLLKEEFVLEAQRINISGLQELQAASYEEIASSFFSEGNYNPEVSSDSPTDEFASSFSFDVYDVLCEYQLLDRTISNDHHPRLTMHDLVKAFALEKMQEESPEEEIRHAKRNLVEGYALGSRSMSSRYLNPVLQEQEAQFQYQQLSEHPETSKELIILGNTYSAITWFDQESSNLLNALQWAQEFQLFESINLICEGLYWYSKYRPLVKPDFVISTYLQAASTTSDNAHLCRGYILSANQHHNKRQFHEAASEYSRAVEIDTDQYWITVAGLGLIKVKVDTNEFQEAEDLLEVWWWGPSDNSREPNARISWDLESEGCWLAATIHHFKGEYLLAGRYLDIARSVSRGHYYYTALYHTYALLFLADLSEWNHFKVILFQFDTMISKLGTPFVRGLHTINKAKMYAESKKDKLSLSLLSEAEKIAQDYNIDELKILTLVEKGKFCIKRKRWAEAEEAFDRALDVNKQNENTYYSALIYQYKTKCSLKLGKSYKEICQYALESIRLFKQIDNKNMMLISLYYFGYVQDSEGKKAQGNRCRDYATKALYEDVWGIRILYKQFEKEVGGIFPIITFCMNTYEFISLILKRRIPVKSLFYPI